MKRSELFRRINDDIIDYLNEPLDSGNQEALDDAVLSVCELVKENIDWYVKNAGAGITVQIKKL